MDLFPDDGSQDEEGAGENQGDSDFEDGVGNLQNKAEGEEGEIAGAEEDAGSQRIRPRVWVRFMVLV